MNTLADRVDHILDKAKLKSADLARIAGVSSATVTYWKSGATREMAFKHASAIEKRLGYRAAWIATGVGPMLLAPSEKEDMITTEEKELVLAFRDLSADQQQALLGEAVKSAEHNRKIVEAALKKRGISDSPEGAVHDR